MWQRNSGAYDRLHVLPAVSSGLEFLIHILTGEGDVRDDREHGEDGEGDEEEERGSGNNGRLLDVLPVDQIHH